uniref:Uncharacterized protein n=1 Tax=Lactuca sativa TaxID=4236 RepID=A0A9R1VDU6_LACSA|nr:hypothetical protein LSAT_V11C500258100 [Lactuca sativa]
MIYCIRRIKSYEDKLKIDDEKEEKRSPKKSLYNFYHQCRRRLPLLSAGPSLFFCYCRRAHHFLSTSVLNIIYHSVPISTTFCQFPISDDLLEMLESPLPPISFLSKELYNCWKV